MKKLLPKYILLSHFLVLLFVIGINKTYSNEYYLSPNGKDTITYNGSINFPWATISYALSKMKQGDILHVLPGTYYETASRYWIGPEKNNIQIIGSGDPVIDGSYREFQVINNGQWELWDASKKIYKSKIAYPDAGSISSHFEYQGKEYKFISRRNQFFSYTDLSSDNEFHIDSDQNMIGMYVGPGIYYDSEGTIGDKGRIYIRLKRSKYMSNEFAYLTDDPNKLKIDLASWESYFRLDSCTGVTIEGLILKQKSIEIRNSSNNINIKNITTDEIISVRSGSECHHITIDNVHFEDCTPYYVAWEDVKSYTSPAQNLESEEIGLGSDCHDITIKNCVFRRNWDAIDVTFNTYNLNIYNNEFYEIRDDCIQLGSGCNNVHIYNNKMIKVASGVSRHGSKNCRPGQVGSKYIHNNIFDCSIPSRFGRQNPDGSFDDWFGGPNNDGIGWHTAFEYHRGDTVGSDGDPRMIYNNTCIFGESSCGACYGLYGVPYRNKSVLQRVYNNIFIQIGKGCIDGYSLYTDGSLTCDGNLFYRVDTNSTMPLFKSIDENKDYYTFASFKTATGWENKGIFINPKLDSNYQPCISEAWGGIDIQSTCPNLPVVDPGLIYKGAVRPIPLVRIENLETKSSNGIQFQQYPNPFNSTITITYELPEKIPVSIVIYNTLGQKIKELFRGSQSGGEYKILWDGKDDKNFSVPSGLFFSELITPKGRFINKMLLIK
jgi:hypothetical protein